MHFYWTKRIQIRLCNPGDNKREASTHFETFIFRCGCDDTRASYLIVCFATYTWPDRRLVKPSTNRWQRLLVAIMTFTITMCRGEAILDQVQICHDRCYIIATSQPTQATFAITTNLGKIMDLHHLQNCLQKCRQFATFYAHVIYPSSILSL